MARIGAMWNHIRGWYENNFTWRGVVALAYFLAKEIPDEFGRKDFWSAKLPAILKIVYEHSTLVTVLLVAGIIWLDHRMVLRRVHGHDTKTLKGRTLAFCDELRAFQKELGKEPQIDYKDSYDSGEFTEKNKELSLRGQKMHHGFHLRFIERAMNLWHEYGLEMRESQPLYSALMGRIDTDERLDAIVGEFSELVKMSED